MPEKTKAELEQENAELRKRLAAAQSTCNQCDGRGTVTVWSSPYTTERVRCVCQR